MVPGSLVNVYNSSFPSEVYRLLSSYKRRFTCLLSKQTQNMFLFLYVLQTVKIICFPLGFLPA